jgi:hypothetical protein
MVKKRARWANSKIEHRLPDSQSPDEVVRGDVARSLCPCHASNKIRKLQRRRQRRDAA